MFIRNMDLENSVEDLGTELYTHKIEFNIIPGALLSPSYTTGFAIEPPCIKAGHNTKNPYRETEDHSLCLSLSTLHTPHTTHTHNTHTHTHTHTK
jgi:hypothetical protein